MTTIKQPAAGLGSGRPSRTSIMVAAGRAFGARDPDPSVRNPDHLAERLLGPAERELIREHPIAAALEGDYQQGRQDMQVASTANLMLVRTRFIDEHLLRALERGATQVVILGAASIRVATGFRTSFAERGSSKSIIMARKSSKSGGLRRF